jgi:uncharacterized protein (DUF697 family)
VVKLPLNLAKTLKALKEASATADDPASIVLAGDKALIERALEEFSSGGTIPAVATTDAFNAPSGYAASPGELLVVLAAADQEAQAEALLERVTTKKSVILAVDQGEGAGPKATYTTGGVVRLAFTDSVAGWDRLFALCAEAAGKSGTALGRRYPVVRRAAARRLIARTAMQNVFIALVFFIPGSDMPPMTANQIKMVLNIAAMYGERVDSERALELAGMVALGFGLRGLGRFLARKVPGLAVVMRMVTAYAATVAVGLGAIAYFEKGAPASTSKVIALAGSMRR